VIRQVDLRRACFEEAKSFRDRLCVGHSEKVGKTFRALDIDDNEEKIRRDIVRGKCKESWTEKKLSQ
jgi:hypothetical protein